MKKYSLMLVAGLLSLGLFLSLGTFSAPSACAQEGEAAAASEDSAAEAKPAKKTAKKKSSKKSSKSKSSKSKKAADDAQPAEVKEETEVKETSESAPAEETAPVEDTEKAEDTEKTEDSAPDEVAGQTEDVADDDNSLDILSNTDDSAVLASVGSSETRTWHSAKESAKSSRKIKKLLEPGSEPGEEVLVKLDDVEYRFCWCPAGKFLMGAPAEEQYYTAEELQHEVTISKGFWMLKTEVTQEMWVALFERNPSYFAAKGFGKNEVQDSESGKALDTVQFPVDRVRWDDAMDFCVEFSRVYGGKFVLPSEAQWEYACRAGSTTPYYTGNSVTPKDANYSHKDKLGRTTTVGSFPANPWNLCDMMGNVGEWCSDVYDKEYYSTLGASVTDPYGPKGKNENWLKTSVDTPRVQRGGYYLAKSYYCRSATRSGYANVNNGYKFDGFRFIIIPGDDEEEAEASETEVEPEVTPDEAPVEEVTAEEPAMEEEPAAEAPADSEE